MNLPIVSPVVTIYTTSLTFNNSAFCPHSVFMWFVWISEQTAIISLYSINWLVFVTKTESVYCAVRRLYCSIHTAQCPAMAQAVIHHPVMAEARFRSHVSLCEICGGRSGSGTVFFPPVPLFSPVSIIPPLLHNHLNLHAALTRRTNGRSLGSF